MKTAAIVSFALFGMTALAAPLSAAKRSPTNYSNTTVVSNSTLPSTTTVLLTASATTAAYKGSRTIFPEIQMQYIPDYSSSLGQNTNNPTIASGPKNQKKVVAYNFIIPAEHTGKMCRFNFRVKSDNYGYIAHEFPEQDQIDVYHPKKSCINDKTPYSELMNIEKTYLGRLKATHEDYSQWIDVATVHEDSSFPTVFDGKVTGFPCNGQELVIELAAHSQNAKITWDTTLQNFGGLTISTYDA